MDQIENMKKEVEISPHFNYYDFVLLTIFCNRMKENGRVFDRNSVSLSLAETLKPHLPSLSN